MDMRERQGIALIQLHRTEVLSTTEAIASAIRNSRRNAKDKGRETFADFKPPQASRQLQKVRQGRSTFDGASRTDKKSRQIIFDGEKLDMEAVWTVRDGFFPAPGGRAVK